MRAEGPGRALAAATRLPLTLAGDLSAGAGLLGGAALGSLGDVVSLVDDTRFTRPLLGAALSTPLQRVAHATSNLGTGIGEGLRGEDIERLPQPLAAYREAAPGAGRLSTAADGVRAWRLALDDLVGATAGVLCELVWWRSGAERIARWRGERRDLWLGPLADAPLGEPAP